MPSKRRIAHTKKTTHTKTTRYKKGQIAKAVGKKFAKGYKC